MESETSNSLAQVAGKIGMLIAAFIFGSILLVVMFVFGIGAIITINQWLYRHEQFRIGGFQLGSYDPARYPSEIVRRP